RDAGGRLIATLEDYRNARRLLTGPMTRLLGTQTSEAAIRFRDRLRGWFHEQQFTTTEARRRETSSKAAAREWIRELYEAGLLEMVSESRGRTPATWKLVADEAGDGASVLPTVEELCTVVV